MEEFLWVERYRPKRVSDTVLPAELKAVFQQFVDQRNIPNLILAGGPGIGKTTIARAMLEELGCDYIVINGSMNGNIDTPAVPITPTIAKDDATNANSVLPRLTRSIEIGTMAYTISGNKIVNG